MTRAERAALALLVWCGFCWAAPGTACIDEGQHLARFHRAYRRGLISRHDMAGRGQIGSRRSGGIRSRAPVGIGTRAGCGPVGALAWPVSQPQGSHRQLGGEPAARVGQAAA